MIQVMTSFYVILHLFEKGVAYDTAILIVGIHLVLYLLSCILKEEHRREWGRWLDWVYIGVMTWQGVQGMVLLVGITSTELWYMQTESLKKWILGLGCIGVSIMVVPQIQGEWFPLVLLILIGYVASENRILVRSLKEERLELLDRVGRMRRKVEAINSAKNEIAYMTQINERNMIAQKLHDEVGHVLAGSIMQLEASKIILQRNQEQGIQMVEQVASHLREGMDTIRRTIKGMKPDTGERGIATIREMLVKLQEEAGVKTGIGIEGDLDCITLERWQVIRLNLQEAITNFMKYSSGDLFQVSIEVFNKLIKVEISDNGRVEPVIKKSLGLQGMEERMLECGGRLVINTEKGFQIIMIFGR